jgi:hypothetical protein
LFGNVLKYVHTLSLLILNVAAAYAILNVQVNQGDLEMTHRVLISADVINLLGKDLKRYIIKKITEDLSVTIKYIDLEGNA